jgi:hypothetical protein
MYPTFRKQGGGKILTMILKKGMELWSGAPWKKFIEEIEAVFQRQILGSPTSPAHSSLNHGGRNDSELTIGKITGQNEIIRRMIRQTDTIIEASLPPGHPLQQKLIGAIQSYCRAITLLGSHHLLSNDEIEEFQDHAVFKLD